jgi:uncharacterized protein
MFELTSREGLPIRCDIDAPREARALAVVVHGFKGFKDWGFFPWLGEYLCDAGIAVTRFNMSRCGIGEAPDVIDRLDLLAGDTYSAQIHDLVDVVRHAQSKFRGLPLFLLGHSRGGGIALLAARDLKEVEGVVTWSSIAHVDRNDPESKAFPAALEDYRKNATRLDILDSAARLDVPLLAVHGGRDQSVSVDESRQIVARARDASLVVIESASHTYNAIHPLVHVPRELEYAATASAHFMNAYA